MDRDYQALLDSDRVGATTRETLAARAHAMSGTKPRPLNPDDFATLEAVTRRLIPQPPGAEWVDVAGGIDRMLSDGIGDGWRYADLPRDREAFESGLRAIEVLTRDRHAVAFVALGPIQQDSVLAAFAVGNDENTGMNAKRWFEELLAAATEIYVSHPTTLARIGFSGIAFRPQWDATGLGTALSWEPRAR